jgi:uncharacterized protein (UPF0261 family)
MSDRFVFLIATLDTKGPDAAHLRDRLTTLGLGVRIVDAGALGNPSLAADVPREEVFCAAGASLEAIRARGDRGEAVTQASEGVARLLVERHARGEVAGVIAIGGSAGTTIGCAAMRALPLGVPKLMISTHASGATRHYVGHKDIVMFNSIVDIAGVNRVSRMVFAQAAAAMAGMIRCGDAAGRGEDRPIVAATMFGVTTPAVEHARALLEQAGYEVLVFHATGSGGEAMEALIREGLVAGVLDLTTTELADELCGGFLSAGSQRLTGAGAMGIPRVISVGALDMVNFYGPETVPEQFRDRRFYRHNANVTLMRTTPEENTRIGAELCRRARQGRGSAAIFLPLEGVSAIDRPGQPFDDPVARQALFAAVRQHHGDVELIERDQHINDPSFAAAMAERLIAMLRAERPAVQRTLT